MGGLVIKKVHDGIRIPYNSLTSYSNHSSYQAHILAHRDRGQCDILDRIRSIFFLATPHKGSDYAALLNNILRVSGFTGISSSREYIDDLTVGSKSTQLINEEFGSCVANLSLFSFYETIQTSIGVSSTIIVDKDSAVLGEYGKMTRMTKQLCSVAANILRRAWISERKSDVS